MREYVISRKIGEVNWDRIPSLDVDTLLWSPEVDISATAQLCYDDAALYVRLTAREGEIRAEETGPLGMPCEDSCLEFFFCPAAEDGRYFNIEFNPNCCMYLGFARDRNAIVRIQPEGFCFAPEAERTGDGWRVTYRVPYDFVRLFFPDFDPKPGGEIRANCYKCGDLTAREHYLSWNPIASATPDFHRSCDFGRMRFE